MTRKIVLWLCAATGAIVICFTVALAGILYWAWPHVPEAPSGTAESPPWGSLDAVITEAQRHGEKLPPFVADAKSGPAADGKVRVLVMSSGGQYGAFGAGVLTGWSRSGFRPYFDVVTGISVGSILAPIAFLGSDYDQKLEQLVQNFATAAERHPISFSDPISLLRAMWGRGFKLTVDIEAILRAFFDESFVELVAGERAKGRNLYVGSTDVTAGKVVIWDLGAIAESTRPDRVRRFQDAILASISVPVVMPATYIETGQPGTYAMHVDGSFLAPIFMTTLIQDYEKIKGNFDVYVVVNNRLNRPQPLETISPRLIDLVPRLFYLVHTSQFERSMDVLLMRSQLHDFTVRILAIPEREELKFSLNFAGKEISDLFRLGVETGRDSKAWITLPQGGLPAYWAPPDEVVEDAEAGSDAK